MRNSRIIAVILLTIFVLLAVSCSKKPDENSETTTDLPVAQSSNISDAIDAFMGNTEYYSGEETYEPFFTQEEDYGDNNEDAEEKTDYHGRETEADLRYESTLSQIFTEKQTEAITTKATTAAATSKTTVKVTIKEGMAMTEIFKKLEENGVASFDALMETAQTYDYSYYPLVAAIPSNANRCFKLEGYLFPNTYEFYTNQKPQDAIGKFLRGSKAKITDEMQSKASSLGYSMDEILTVASIIEKEGANSNEVAKIAAVIYNRLDEGMKLQMDSSIYYIERHVKPYLTGDINRYNSYYNTYKCKALPAGPISNPGMRTINAALNPADVPYLYFCHDENANYYYAETYEEHQENLKKAGLA